MDKKIYRILMLGFVLCGLSNCSYLTKYELDGLKKHISDQTACPEDKITIGPIEYSDSTKTIRTVACGDKKFRCTQEQVMERNWHGSVTMGVYQEGQASCKPLAN